MIIAAIAVVSLPEKQLVVVREPRGMSCPGGKHERGETFAECATRELYEETGLIGKVNKFIWGSISDDGNYCYAFDVELIGGRKQQIITGWDDLMQDSPFRGFYHILREVYKPDSYLQHHNRSILL